MTERRWVRVLSRSLRAAGRGPIPPTEGSGGLAFDYTRITTTRAYGRRRHPLPHLNPEYLLGLAPRACRPGAEEGSDGGDRANGTLGEAGQKPQYAAPSGESRNRPAPPPSPSTPPTTDGR